MCTACDGENEYADEPGLITCKTCPVGSAGVTESGGAVARSGPHTACSDSTCELPAARVVRIDSNATIGDPCPGHGSHVGGSPDNCTLGCKPGYSGGVIWTCKKDSSSNVTASYQGSTEPWCVDDPCPDTDPASGTTPSANESATGTGIAVTCATGYSTSDTATCYANNSWILPICTGAGYV